MKDRTGHLIDIFVMVVILSVLVIVAIPLNAEHKALFASIALFQLFLMIGLSIITRR